MAKTQDEINELLASDLFQKGIKDKYIIINEGNSIIRYNCKNHLGYNKYYHWSMFLIHDRKTINHTLYQVQDIKYLFLCLIKLYL